MQKNHIKQHVISLSQMQDNKAFLSMINNVLQTDGFYFATDYDLTHSLQRLANTSPEFQEMSLLERVGGAGRGYGWCRTGGMVLRCCFASPCICIQFVIPTARL